VSGALSQAWRAARATLLAAGALALIGVVFGRAGLTRGVAADLRARLAGAANPARLAISTTAISARVHFCHIIGLSFLWSWRAGNGGALPPRWAR